MLNFKELEVEKIDVQTTLSLIGKLLIKNHFNPYSIKATFKNVWKLSKAVNVNELNKISLHSNFFLMLVRRSSLTSEPWGFDGCILNHTKGHKHPSKVDFKKTRF